MNNQFDNDARLYGDDLIQGVQRWAQPVVDRRVAHLEGQIGQLRTQTARDRVMAALDADAELGGNWRTINDDPAFLAWLNTVHDLSGQPRITLLRKAFDAGDPQRTGAFFRAFLASRTPARERTATRLPMENPAQSRRQPPISATVAGQGKRWTRAEISKFYEDCRLGRYDQREGDRIKLEQDILAASRDGRIVDPLPKLTSDM